MYSHHHVASNSTSKKWPGSGYGTRRTIAGSIGKFIPQRTYRLSIGRRVDVLSIAAWLQVSLVFCSGGHLLAGDGNHSPGPVAGWRLPQRKIVRTPTPPRLRMGECPFSLRNLSVTGSMCAKYPRNFQFSKKPKGGCQHVPRAAHFCLKFSCVAPLVSNQPLEALGGIQNNSRSIGLLKSYILPI